MVDRGEGALLKPFRDVLVPRLAMLGDVLVKYQEALPLEPPSNDLCVVLHAIGLGRIGVIVLGNRPARNYGMLELLTLQGMSDNLTYTSEIFHVGDRYVQ